MIETDRFSSSGCASVHVSVFLSHVDRVEVLVKGQVEGSIAPGDRDANLDGFRRDEHMLSFAVVLMESGARFGVVSVNHQVKPLLVAAPKDR